MLHGHPLPACRVGRQVQDVGSLPVYAKPRALSVTMFYDLKERPRVRPMEQDSWTGRLFVLVDEDLAHREARKVSG